MNGLTGKTLTEDDHREERDGRREILIQREWRKRNIKRGERWRKRNPNTDRTH